MFVGGGGGGGVKTSKCTEICENPLTTKPGETHNYLKFGNLKKKKKINILHYRNFIFSSKYHWCTARNNTLPFFVPADLRKVIIRYINSSSQISSKEDWGGPNPLY